MYMTGRDKDKGLIGKISNALISKKETGTGSIVRSIES